MPNPYAGGSEKNKLFTHASSVKGNTDKAAIVFAETHAGRGIYDVSGGTATLNTNLPKSSSVSRG